MCCFCLCHFKEFGRMPWTKQVLQNLIYSLRHERLLHFFLSVNSFIVFFLFLFTAAPVEYGSSQARGWIGAAASSLHHSHGNTGSKPCLWPTPQLAAMPDPQPTGLGRILVDPESSWKLIGFLSCWATTGTPIHSYLPQFITLYVGMFIRQLFNASIIW